MSVQKDRRAWRVRWREGQRWRSRTFDRKRDAEVFDRERKRAAQLGTLADLDRGQQTLDQYVRETWAPTFGVLLAPKTMRLYDGLYGHHLSPTLGGLPLRSITPAIVGRWQADRLASGAGPVAVAKSLTLLGNLLERAVEAGSMASNPVRKVRRAKLPRRSEVRPLAPLTIERMRQASSPRDSALVAVLAYAGLRPGEALALQWRDIGEQTIMVERAVSLGQLKDTKTGQHRAVRLIGPLKADLESWRLQCGSPSDRALVFPSQNGGPWTQSAYQSWRRKAFGRALKAAGVEDATPYTLRHSFVSLMVAEGRSVVYIAAQAGHDPTLTLGRYAHLIAELDDRPKIDAEAEIDKARATLANPVERMRS